MRSRYPRRSSRWSWARWPPLSGLAGGDELVLAVQHGADELQDVIGHDGSLCFGAGGSRAPRMLVRS
jgi:hypothetical protein